MKEVNLAEISNDNFLQDIATLLKGIWPWTDTISADDAMRFHYQWAGELTKSKHGQKLKTIIFERAQLWRLVANLLEKRRVEDQV
jgi:hypothetical protein